MGLPKYSGHVWIVNGSVVTDSEGKNLNINIYGKKYNYLRIL
jgi:hypothetical protein